ncbi:MAG: PAS domain S-box protein [Nitrospirae bacterium]|nr:PAS domain S-box protein [Nitrospirota bacterium]
MRYTIKLKLASIILVIFIPLVFFSINHYFTMLKHEKEDMQVRNYKAASDIANYLDEVISKSFAFLQALSKHPAVINKDPKECDRLFSELLPSYPHHLNILAAGMDGYNYGSGVPSPDVRTLNYNDKEWFQRALREKMLVGDLHISKLFKIPAVMIAIPVFDRKQKQVGVIGAPLNLSRVQDAIEQSWKLPDKSIISVIDSKGIILINTLNREFVKKNIKNVHGAADILEKKEGSFEEVDSDGTERVHSIFSLSNVQWKVIVAVPSQEAYRSAYHFSRNYAVVLFAVIISAVAFSIFFLRRITRNISSLSAGLKEIEKGNLDFKLHLAGHDELTDIAESFNQMTYERKKAEDKLKESESFRTSILEGIGEGVVVIDKDFKIVSANNGYCNQVGIKCDEIIGKYCFEVSHHLEKPCYEKEKGCECTVKKCFETGGHHRAIHTHYDINDNPLYIETNAYSLKDAAGNILAVIETLMDVTDRVKLEKRLEETKKQYKDLYDEAPDMMHSIDKDGNIVICNKTEADALGYDFDEIMGKPFLNIIAPETRSACAKKIETLKHTGFFSGEITLIAKNGKRIPVFVISNAIYDNKGEFLMSDAILRDITEKKLLEAQLLQAQKMEAIGQLAGGIAHDFNNMLTAIMGYGNLLQTKLGKDNEGKTYVDEIMAAAEQAASLAQNLLAFSRKQIINPKPIKLSEVITHVDNLLKRVIGENIELKVFLSPHEATVIADFSQIEQGLMNLCTNARDAMPEGGVLLIETEIVEFDKDYVKRHAFAKPGKYMAISVTDTGTGLDEKTKERIFEPFFTTKETGKGTGLGLAMVYGIVKQHDGYINVYSEIGKGTTFRIYLPVSDIEAESLHVSAQLPVRGGNETILIAEDESSIRGLSKNVLEEYGYKVILAQDGEEAVEQFKAYQDTIDILLIDALMPKKNGKEVYNEIKTFKHDIKAIFMSGYTANIIHTKGILESDLELISKPFSPNMLLRKIREVLDK